MTAETVDYYSEYYCYDDECENPTEEFKDWAYEAIEDEIINAAFETDLRCMG